MSSIFPSQLQYNFAADFPGPVLRKSIRRQMTNFLAALATKANYPVFRLALTTQLCYNNLCIAS